MSYRYTNRPAPAIAYRGYLCTYSPVQDQWYISCDGYPIGSGRLYADCKATIDQLARLTRDQEPRQWIIKITGPTDAQTVTLDRDVMLDAATMLTKAASDIRRATENTRDPVKLRAYHSSAIANVHAALARLTP